VKHILKRGIGLVLALMLLLSTALPAAAEADSGEVITVFCVSNCYNSSDSAVELWLLKKGAYIRAKDAATYSGFLLNESNGMPVFTRGDTRVGISSYESDGTEFWIPLSSGLEQLDTQIELEGGVLWFTARKHTFADLLEITDELVQEPYYLKEMFQSTVGNMGKFGAWLINLISNDPVEELRVSIGSALKTGDGTQSEKDYQEVLLSLMESSETDPILLSAEAEYQAGKDILNAAKKIIKSVSNLKKLDNFMLKLAKDKVFMDLLEEASYQGLPGSGLASILGSKTMKYYMNKSVDHSSDSLLKKMLPMLDEKTAEIVEINGLDISSQLDIAQYMYSVATAGTVYQSMILNTYFANKNNINYAPKLSKSVLRDIRDAANDKVIDDIVNLLSNEITTILGKSIDATIKNLLKQGFFNGSMDYVIFQIAKSAVAFCIDATTGFTAKKSASYIERCVALAELQDGIKNMYNDYKHDMDNALTVKYAALMYARCYQLAYEILCEVDKTTPMIHNKQELIILSQISDRDLTANVNNPEYTIEELRLAAELYKQTGGTIEDNTLEVDSRLELGNFLGGPLLQLMIAIPGCRGDAQTYSFSTPDTVVQGEYNTNITFISLRFLNKSVFNYQLYGIYPGMALEQGLNILNVQGFQMEHDGNKWIGTSGNISLEFFTTFGNSISHISAKRIGETEKPFSMDMSECIGMPLDEFLAAYPQFEYLSENCYQAKVGGEPAVDVYFMNNYNQSLIYGFCLYPAAGNTYSFHGMVYGMEIEQLKTLANDHGLTLEGHSTSSTSIYNSTAYLLGGDNLKGTMTWFAQEVSHYFSVEAVDRQLLLEDSFGYNPSGGNAGPEEDVDYSQYLGIWYSDDSECTDSPWEMTLEITEYFDAMFTFDLSRRKIWCSDPDEEAHLTTDGNADFEIYNDYTLEFEMDGKLHFGEDTITLEIGNSTAAYMEDCAGQAIVFRHDANGANKESGTNVGTPVEIDYNHFIGEWECGTQFDEGKEYTLTIHEVNEHEIVFELYIYRLHYTTITRAQSIGDGIYTFEAFDDNNVNQSISGVLRLESGEGDGQELIDRIIMDVDTCTLEYSTDMTGGFFEFEPAYPIITFIYTGDTPVSIAPVMPAPVTPKPVSETIYEDYDSGTELTLRSDSTFELYLDTTVGSDTLIGTYRTSDTDLYGEYWGDVSNFIFLNVQSCNSSSNIWKYTGKPQEIMLGEADYLYLTDIKCGGYWYTTADYDFIYKELVKSGSGNYGGDGSYDNSEDGGSIVWTPLYTAVVVNCENWVSLREDPNTKATRLKKVPFGSKVDVYEVRDDRFSYCEYGGEWGYILSEYLAKEGSVSYESSKPSTQTSSSYVKAVSHKVNMRDAPNLSGKDIGTMSDGETATYLGSKSTDNRGVVWYKVSFKGKTGWVSSKYTKMYN